MTLLYVAACLVVLLGVAHSVLGERFIVIRLFRRDDLPKLFGSSAFTIRTLRFAWHITTIAWFGLAAMLVLAARGDLTTHGVLKIIAATSIASGFLPLVFTRGKHLAWIVFFAVGGIAFWSAL